MQQVMFYLSFDNVSLGLQYWLRRIYIVPATQLWQH